MQVVAWSQNLTSERADEVGVIAVTKDELLSTSRFVTLHLKVSDRTRDIIGPSDLARTRQVVEGIRAFLDGSPIRILNT